MTKTNLIDFSAHFLDSLRNKKKSIGPTSATIAKVAGAVALGAVGVRLGVVACQTLSTWFLIRKLKKQGVLTQKQVDNYVDAINHPYDYDSDPASRGVLMEEGWIQRGMFAGPALDDLADVMSHKTWSYDQAKFQSERLGIEEAEFREKYLGTKIMSEEIKLTRVINEKISSAASIPVQEHKPIVVLPPTLPHHHMGNELITLPVHEDYPALTPDWVHLIEILRKYKNVRWVGTKTKTPASRIQPRCRDFIEHPNYGKYGMYDYPIKADFEAVVRNSPTYKSPTRSVVLDKHLPLFLPRWNRNDPMTLGHAAAGRLGREPVPPEQIHMDVMEPFIRHAVDIIIDELTEAGLHPTLITPQMSWQWLAKQHFPSSKKKKYCEAFASVTCDDDFIMPSSFRNQHEAFAKNESYAGATKAQRLILAGDYQMAAVLAPACDILGDYLFSRQFTSKKIPERMRPVVALRRFRGRVVLNDMSAFEGSITSRIKDLIEHRILRHFFPNIGPWLDRANEPLDINIVDRGSKTKLVRFHLDSVRCSGDPQTSLGNTLTNYASILAARMWAREENPIQFARQTVAWVEGDDSLVSYDFENDQEFIRYRQAFINMGFAAKMELKEFVGDAGYCSQFFDREGNNCPRVAQTLIDFPWSHSAYLGHGMELLALKAMSLQASCPGQPLVYGLLQRYSQIQGIAVLEHNAYLYEEMKREGLEVSLNSKNMTFRVHDFEPTAPSRAQRLLFEEKYGISPIDQMAIERDIRENGLDHINLFTMMRLCERDGIDYASCAMFYADHINISHPTPGKMFVATIKRSGCKIRFPQLHRRRTALPEAHVLEPIDPVPAALAKLKTIREIRQRHISNPTYRAGNLSLRKATAYFVIICVLLLSKFVCRYFDTFWLNKLVNWILLPSFLKLLTVFCGDITGQMVDDIREVLAL